MSRLGDTPLGCVDATSLESESPDMPAPMNKRYFHLMEWRRPIDWIGFGFLGLVLIATGTVAFVTGETHYGNFWGAPVFAPFAVVIGLLLLVAVFAQWRKWK